MGNIVGKFYRVDLEEYKNNSQNKTFEDEYEAIKLPKRATKHSAGYDFYAPFDFILKAGETIKIPTGIKVQINDGWFLGIVSRSSLGFKYRLQLDNVFGVIDGDYFNNPNNQGHIFIKITNDSRDNKTLEIKKGEAFAQGIFLQYGITEDDNVEAERIGGFGSTGK